MEISGFEYSKNILSFYHSYQSSSNKKDKQDFFKTQSDFILFSSAFKIKLLNNKGKFLRIHCDMQQNTIREPYSLVTLSNEVYGMEVLTETERIKIKNEIDEYHQGLKKSKEVMGDISNKDTSNNSTKNSKYLEISN